MLMIIFFFNPVALRKAKIGLSAIRLNNSLVAFIGK